MKISTKLYAGFILVVALTAALGLYISYVNSKFLIEDTGRDGVFQSKEIIKRFDQAIHDKIMEVGAATKRSWISSIVAESNSLFEQLENIDGYLAEKESQWTAVARENTNAMQQELMSNSLANELRDEFITFYEDMRGQRVLCNLLVTNKYGASIAQTDEIDHFRHDTEMWWQEAKRLGIFTGQVEYDKGNISVAFRINDTNGNFIGVLKTVIDIKAQFRTIELSSMEYQTTQTTMLTIDGRIIYRTRPYRFMEDFSTWKYFDRLQEKDNSFIGVSKGNKKKLYSFSRTKDHDRRYGFGWILILESDLDDIMVPAHTLRNHIAIVSLVLIILGTTIAFLISSSITRSLTKLNEGAAQIGKGDLNYLLETKGKDEFSPLACSFNTMVQNLQKITASRDELNREIKERQSTESALKESEDKYRQMFEDNTAIKLIIDPIDGTIFDANSAATEFYGYNIVQLKKMNIMDINILPPEKVDAEMLKAKLNKRKYFDFQHKLSSGEIRDVEVHSSPITYKGQKILFSIIHDITDRKKAERSLREKHLQLQAILDYSPALISIKDMEGTVILASRNFEVLDIPPLEEFIGKNVFELFPEEEAEALWHNDLMALEAGRPIEAEEMVTHKDGTIHTYFTVKFPLYEENRKAFGVCAISTDITARKQAQEGKEKLEIKLQQTQKMETIGTLAGGIAHDFNNILFPIIGFAELLMEDILDDSPLRDGLSEILTGALRARDLVKQILTFSRQDNSELKLIKLQPVIIEALKLIRSTIPTTINIKQDIKDNCGIIKADPTQMHQVVMNLATNAYHAMENSGGDLKVILKEIILGRQDVIGLDIGPGNYACLTVADTGTGMDKYTISKAFDPYFTTKEQGKGTGMGLSVIHGIVKNAGGSINIYSEVGQGTELHIYLPVVKSSSEQRELQRKEPIQGGTEQILLVDDETVILKMGKMVLERLGYQVVCCDSSLNALEIFRATPDKFDLVITDMAMPNMPGDKLAAELIKLRPGIPILLCTGFSERIPKEKAMSIGVKGFLMKPIVKADLSLKIREILDN